MIYVSQQELAIITGILKKHLPGGKAYVFGSRYRGNHQPYSDLDLLIKPPQQMGIAALGALQEDFAASLLPFCVDVVDYWAISPEFWQAIAQENALIYSGAELCE